LGPIPNPQSPIPNPHKLKHILIIFRFIRMKLFKK
jgi:hypothetical protein